jgi:hypothetical protein
LVGFSTIFSTWWAIKFPSSESWVSRALLELTAENSAKTYRALKPMRVVKTRKVIIKSDMVAK